MKALLKIVGVLRRILEPITFFINKPRRIKLDNTKYEELLSLGLEDFVKEVNKYKYKSDKLQGFFDFSYPVKKVSKYFFADLKFGRDCDDYSRLFVRYMLDKGYTNVKEILITDKKHPFTTSHFVSIGTSPEGRVHLFNYYLHQAMAGVKDEKEQYAQLMDILKIMHSDNSVLVVYKKFKK